MTQNLATRSQSLIDLASEALRLSQAILEAGGEITPEVDALLIVNEQELGLKADAYAAVLDRMKAEEELWRTRRDDCLRMLRAYEAVQDRLRERMKAAMIAMGREEILGATERFKLTKSKAALVLDNDLPQDCYMTVTEIVIDKERVRQRLESGEEIPGAKLVPGVALRRYVNRKE